MTNPEASDGHRRQEVAIVGANAGAKSTPDYAARPLKRPGFAAVQIVIAQAIVVLQVGGLGGNASTRQVSRRRCREERDVRNSPRD